MYYVMVTALMLVLPVASILVEWAASGAALIPLIGKWFVFWAVGVRLFLAGLRQVFTPDFTAETIFATTDAGAKKIVSELGMGNMAIGAISILSLYFAAWIMPAAIAGAIFYGSAGIKHVANTGKNRLETFATMSDLWVALVLAFHIVATAVAAG